MKSPMSPLQPTPLLSPLINDRENRTHLTYGNDLKRLIKSSGFSITVEICEEHHIAMVRHQAFQLAKKLTISRINAHYVATSVSELGHNLFFHATRGGTLTLQAVISHRDQHGILIRAKDDGPGIENINLAMQDGFSTIGGLGGGLPGVYRMMDHFDIRSSPGKSTQISAIKWD
ncbi:ATP-binding protein [Magnetococcales bacterium HHB-1]